MELRKVTDDNFRALCALSVHDGQRSFVADNSLSLIEAYLALSSGRTAQPFGLYDGDKPVGFAMLSYDNYDPGDPDIVRGTYCLWRFMIDARHQGRGLGRAALGAVLDWARTRPLGPSDFIWLSYEPENTGARALYRSMGFRENGAVCGEEIIAVRPLEPQKQ